MNNSLADKAMLVNEANTAKVALYLVGAFLAIHANSGICELGETQLQCLILQ